MRIIFDRDAYGTLLIYVGELTFSIRHWWRPCPMGCSKYYGEAWDRWDDPCWICNDERWILWYRGWWKQFRMWWYYAMGSRWFEWKYRHLRETCPQCEAHHWYPDWPYTNKCTLCDGRGDVWKITAMLWRYDPRLVDRDKTYE
jgi:hypothetical protein